MLSWEITDPDTKMDDGKPFIISSRFTWSMHEKSTLRKTLEKAVRGKKFDDADFGPGGFDTHKLLGAGCFPVCHPRDQGRQNVRQYRRHRQASEWFGAYGLRKTRWSISRSILPSSIGKSSMASLMACRRSLKKSPEYHAALSKPATQDDYPESHGEIGMDDIPF